jgi:hypothetical protein
MSRLPLYPTDDEMARMQAAVARAHERHSEDAGSDRHPDFAEVGGGPMEGDQNPEFWADVEAELTSEFPD